MTSVEAEQILPARLEMQYGVSGWRGSSSCIGSFFGSPYTDADEAKTRRRTPSSAAAANTLWLPAMFTSIDSCGSATDRLIDTVAKWTTWVQPRIAARTAPPYRTSPSTSSTSPPVANRATRSRSPLVMLSKTRTE